MNHPPVPFETRTSDRLSLPPSSLLEITNNNGRIELTGWDRSEVAFEIQTRADEKDKLTRVAPRFTRTGKGLHLEILENYLPQDAYDYRCDGPGKRFLPALTTLTLRLPRNLALKVQSHNADLAIINLNGALDITTFNGILDFTLSRGSNQQITAHTFNGKLILPEPAFAWQDNRRREASGRFGNGSMPARLDSFNGTVRVR